MFLTILLLIVAGFSSYAQQPILQGKVTDSLKPLAYANILAVPESDNLDIAFAIYYTSF